MSRSAGKPHAGSREPVSRRKFLASAGVGAAAVVGGSLMSNTRRSFAAVAEGSHTYRERSHKYPWWVQTMDQPTVEIDLARAEQPNPALNINAGWRFPAGTKPEERVFAPVGGPGIFGVDKAREMLLQRDAAGAENIRKGVPGCTLADYALRDAAAMHMHASYEKMPVDYSDFMAYVQTPEQRGVAKWTGTPEDAADMVEAAGVFLGADQVGFSAYDPIYMFRGADAKIPPTFKYVITLAVRASSETIKRAPSALGDAGERAAYSRCFTAARSLEAFIKALGYHTTSVPGEWVPLAMMAGIGEVGRTGRIVSPIYGADVRLWCMLTDLPVALDKPIDFGLQAFCRACKKCGTVCPNGAINMADDPSWDPVCVTNVPGKRVWFEDAPKCAQWTMVNDLYCSACHAACPWTKHDVAAIHGIIRATGAKAPGLARLLVALDDTFGYGLKPEAERGEWWKLDLPAFGIDTMQGKS